MQRYIHRRIEPELLGALRDYPVVALLGPRQCGKSTLALKIASHFPESVRLDLESPADLRKLSDPEFYLSRQSSKMVCIDEIQRMPDLFPVLRSLVDRDRRNGRFLVLGSASRELIRQSSESLAGRVCYLELPPFQLDEISPQEVSLEDLWLRGGFPESLLKKSLRSSINWRENLIRTFFEQDLFMMGVNLPPLTMRRFCTMLAHNHGQTLNASKLGASLGVSHTTIARYIDVLEGAFMIRVLRPLATNLKKRLVKSPKVYIRDSGILHTLLEIDDMEDLYAHPVFGMSWEGFAMENLLNARRNWSASFYRTSSGEEVDLLLKRKSRVLAFEFKASTSPKLSKGIHNTLAALKADHCFVVSPVDESYDMYENISVVDLKSALKVVSDRCI